MLILTRYPGERIRIESAIGNHLWIDCDEQGILYGNDIAIPWKENAQLDFDGADIVIAHLGSYGRTRITHRIGIEAPKNYVILREELIGNTNPKGENNGH